ncbi:hypothetical protein [Rhodococcus zopfii]|uniref:hypothetical protein n=1 Tax=Rhodococcus zopfii TaxID=43772 RepID=UPI00093288A4|nr:hypothetical protein [Rhodococcus zopfii]
MTAVNSAVRGLGLDVVVEDQGLEFDDSLIEGLGAPWLRFECVADAEVERQLVDIAVVHPEDLAEEVHRLPLLGATKDDCLTLGDAELVLSEQTRVVEGELDDVLVRLVQVSVVVVNGIWTLRGVGDPSESGGVGVEVGVGVSVVVPCHAGTDDCAWSDALEDFDSGSVSACLHERAARANLNCACAIRCFVRLEHVEDGVAKTTVSRIGDTNRVAEHSCAHGNVLCKLCGRSDGDHSSAR